MALTNNVKVNAWLDEVIPLLKPDAVELITGEKEQLDRLTAEAVSTGEFITLNQEKLPGCYLHRTDPQRRGAGGRPYLYLLAKRRRRRPHQQLDGSQGDVRKAATSSMTAR